jgi:hypothetical protein
MNTGALNLLVFREERRCVSGRELQQGLLKDLSEAERVHSQDALLRALLRAGELECCVADLDASPAVLESITDRLAEVLVGGGLPSNFHSIKTLLAGAALPDRMRVSVPEGFAYYALHPLAYADVVSRLDLSAGAVVVGIRSIGTTLSATTAAAVKKSGRAVSRMTVRPVGHAYNRRMEFSSSQLAFIRQALADSADFLVVDEGPGLSGSSFLCVAEALLEAGVPRTKITLICGHQPDIERFCCENGPSRAQQFRWVAVPATERKPEGADFYIGGGDWRKVLLPKASAWPASWISFERVKYLSAPEWSEPRLFKFLGLGHYADEALHREQVLAEAGFGPAVRREAHGFASYPQLPGRPMSRRDLSAHALCRIAEYCAFRRRNFRQNLGNLDSLQQMAEHNLAELNLDIPIKLELKHSVIADGHMQPHEWLLLPDGQMLKSDSGSHGDDHFFPGPTDIAWDLAGAIVEWGMDERQADFFLEQYHRLSGDEAGRRIGSFLTAYSVFRHAYCLMAAKALRETDEQHLLDLEADNYRRALVSSSAGLTVSAS